MNKQDANWYLGKKCALVYSSKKKKVVDPLAKQKPLKRVVWGKVSRSHGKSGMVRARFTKNLNPEWMGMEVRVMLYPANN